VNEGYAVLLVVSTSHALRAETLLRQSGVTSKLIPVPRHLSSDCGVCVRIAQQDVEQALAVLQSSGLTFELHTL
jgi:bacterioferritin-associated ferredoxin